VGRSRSGLPSFTTLHRRAPEPQATWIKAREIIHSAH
jgi:hypothetical protein